MCIRDRATTVQRIVHVARKLEGPPDVSRTPAPEPRPEAPIPGAAADEGDEYGEGGTGA